MAVPDVSVIIATFRREELLLEAVASACAQRGPTVEVIVVDDSPEGSAAEAMRAVADPRVRYVHPSCSSGGYPGSVRNHGVTMARAPLVAFLDDDDRFFDDALLKLSGAISVTGRPMAYGRVVPFGDDRRLCEGQRAYFDRVAEASRRIRGRQWFAAQLLFGEMTFVNSACMIRRDAFEQFDGYDARLRCCEDVELFLRVGRKLGFTFVDGDVLQYRVGAPSIMNESRRTQGAADRDRIAASYRAIHDRYKETHGVVEYRMLQAFARATNLPAVRKRLPSRPTYHEVLQPTA